ncbi:MAG: sensor histidine kinase, partial [Planctomycetota bacterium]
MVRSIRWRIQLWHSAVLLLVVECFAAFLYWRIEQAQFATIDSELEGAGQSLVSVLRSIPPRELDRPGTLEQATWRPPEPAAGPPPGPPGPPPRPGEFPPEERHRRQMARFSSNLVLADGFVNRYNDRPEGGPYFVVWKASGEVMKASSTAAARLRRPAPRELVWTSRPPGPRLPPAEPRLPPAELRLPMAGSRAGPLPINTQPFNTLPPETLVDDRNGVAWRQRGVIREVVMEGPVGTLVMVGRPLDSEFADLRQWLVLLVASGAGLVALGIIGGAILSYRSLRSLRVMSDAAAGISERNLSERIDTHKVDQELLDLAETLNSAFGRLEQAFARQMQFTADASHELRTPLTVLLGNLELAVRQPGLADDTRHSLEASLRAARRMRGLVDNLLTLARADSGVLEIDRQSFDLGDTVEECAQLLEPLARNKNVKILRDIQPLETQGDPRLLAQVVINLITNAIQYNRDGGNVKISLAVKGDFVELIVADTGLG